MRFRNLKFFLLIASFLIHQLLIVSYPPVVTALPYAAASRALWYIIQALGAAYTVQETVERIVRPSGDATQEDKEKLRSGIEELENALRNEIAYNSGKIAQNRNNIAANSEAIRLNSEEIASLRGIIEHAKNVLEGRINNLDQQVAVIADNVDFVKKELMQKVLHNYQPDGKPSIALIPFRTPYETFTFNGERVDSSNVNRILMGELMSGLVKPDMFHMLDREYIEEKVGEQKLLQYTDSTIAEIRQLGIQLRADYILVGSLEKAHSEIRSFKDITGFQSEFISGNIKITYRIIEVVTGKVLLAKTSDAFVTNNDLIAYNTDDAANVLVQKVSQNASERIWLGIMKNILNNEQEE